MKILSITFIVLFYSIASLGQKQICLLTDTLFKSEVFLDSADLSATAKGNSDRILFTEYSVPLNQDNCIKYKKMKKTGTIIASVGGGLLCSGIIMISVGFQIAFSQVGGSPTYEQNAADGLVIGGGLSIALGFCGVSSGIPLAVIGSKRMKKYCGESKSTMMLSKQGTGLALNF